MAKQLEAKSMSLTSMKNEILAYIDRAVQSCYLPYKQTVTPVEVETNTETAENENQEEGTAASDQQTSSGSESTTIVYDVDLSNVETQLTEINSNIIQLGSLISGMNLFLGVIVGVILIKGIYDRFRA